MFDKILDEDFEYIDNNLDEDLRLMNARFFITGASGFLASYLIKAIFFISKKKSYNIKVFALVRDTVRAHHVFSDSKELIDSGSLSFIEQDVINPINIDEDIDFIIHAASKASPKYYSIDPVGVSLVNTLGTYNCLELAKEVNCKSFLFFSSGEVYGDVPIDKVPTSEEYSGLVNSMNVRSCYAESKRMGENLCVSYLMQFGIPCKIVRPFHTYGPGLPLDDGRVFCDFVRDVSQNKNIMMKSDGSARRSFCYSSDATLGFLKVLLNGENGEAYNIGNPECCVSIKELAKILVKIYPEKNLKVTIGKRNDADNYMESPINVNCPDIKKAKSLSWSPQTNISDGFRKTIETVL
jgi:nucleoside-diphosphate-sugar epimerase